MASLRHGTPLWVDGSHRQRKPRFPHLKNDRQADVVIAGGGITGAIAAYLFSRAGVKVALLESNAVGLGSTAASTALIMQEPDRDFIDLAKRYGRNTAIEIWKALATATRDLSKTIRALRLDCDFCSRDSIYFTLDPRELRRLRREFEHRHRAGLPGRWLSAEDLFRQTGIAGEGAIRTGGNAEVNPVKACYGFLRAAARQGAQIFEQSAARKIVRTKGGLIVHTDRGTVTAKLLLVATGYATRSFKPLVGRFRLKDTYVLATRRIPTSRRRTLLPDGAMAWDTARPYHYLRWTKDGRLLLGGEDTNHRQSGGSRRRIARATDRLLEYLARVHPRLVNERLDYAWEGLFAETRDGLPYVGTHARFPKHLFALGYGGNGMTASFLAATLLLQRYQRGEPHPAERLFAFGRARARR